MDDKKRDNIIMKKRGLRRLMPTRREFIRDLGIGAVVAGTGGFLATELFPAEASDQPSLDVPNTHPNVDPIKQVHKAIIEEVDENTITAVIDGGSTRFTLPAVGFGSWTHRVGDQVAVAKDYYDVWSIYPFVDRVEGVAPATVNVGSKITIGDIEAKVPNQEVKGAIEKISPSSTVDTNWLITNNTLSGDKTIFAVLE